MYIVIRSNTQTCILELDLVPSVPWGWGEGGVSLCTASSLARVGYGTVIGWPREVISHIVLFLIGLNCHKTACNTCRPGNIPDATIKDQGRCLLGSLTRTCDSLGWKMGEVPQMILWGITFDSVRFDGKVTNTRSSNLGRGWGRWGFLLSSTVATAVALADIMDLESTIIRVDEY